MWVSRSLESLSSRTRAFIDRLRGAGSDRADDCDDGYMALDAPRGLDADGFETVRVDTGAEQAEIFITKPSEAAYFDHDEAVEPVLLGISKPDVAVDDIVEPQARREKVAVGEPADLFINALRRPAYQKFDSTVPVIKKKAVAEPAPIAVEPVIEQIVFEAEELEEVTPAIIAPEIPAEDVETVVDDVVIAEEPDPVFMEALEVESARVDCEMSHEIIESAIESQPAAKFEIGDEVFDMSCLEVEEAPYTAKFEIGDEVFDMSALDFVEESYAPVTKFEIGDEVFDMSALEVEEAPYTAKFEIGDEVFDMSALDFVEEPYTPAAKFEIGDEVFDMSCLDVEEAPAAEPATVYALPSPRTVTRSLPSKITVEELEKEESDTKLAAGMYTGMEMIPTSGSTVEARRSEDITLEQVRPMPAVIVNEDRDVLFAFRSDLECDEKEFVSTSYDDNLAFRDDYLDETECTFKFRAKIERPRFNGDLRSLYSY